MDITLQDVFWVVGGIVVFTAFMLARPQLEGLLGALRLRYLRPEAWSTWLDRVADQASTVKSSDAHDTALMSRTAGSTADRPGSGTGSLDPVPGQQHQVAPALVPDFHYVIDYLSRHKLDTPEQVVDVLSVLQSGEGHVFSANKIRDLVGGNEAAVKARVASHRPKHEPPKQPASRRLERPVEGW
jgi:hypothetical protein